MWTVDCCFYAFITIIILDYTMENISDAYFERYACESRIVAKLVTKYNN